MSDHSFLRRILTSPLETTAHYYAERLNENEKAHSFLRRNLLAADSNLRVGFSDRTLGKQLPGNQLKAGREVRQRLQGVRILKATGHEAFRGFVTVPLTDIQGNTTGIYGLRVDKHGEGEAEQQIGNGIFNATALASFEEVIVCADVLDAWTFCGAGYRNVITAAGMELLREHFVNVRRVLLADPDIDCDPVDGLELLRINFPNGVSVNEYALQHASVDDALGKRIRAASWISGAPSQVERSETDQPTTNTNALVERSEATPQQPVASPTPAIIDDLQVERSETEVTLTIESRRWRVRSLERNTTIGVLKVNVMVFNDRNDRFHVDTLDLYHARSRRVFLKEAGEEIAVNEHELRSDLGRVLLMLEQLQQDLLKRGKPTAPKVELTDAERSEAMGLLKDERLLDRILEDFDACGIVGERIGKLTGYLAATSRLLPKPLGVVIQSSSAAGKTSLLDAILAFMPSEQQFGCSAMTSKSLYYAGNLDLRHKILSVAEEEGVRDASYALKLLQSEGKLSIVTTAKESGTGRTAVERYDVEGPVTLLLTTTASDVDPELMNRCFVLSVDEDSKQTAAIQERQRNAETLEEILAAEHAKQTRKLHQNAQRLLKPIRIVNHYAAQLSFAKSRVRNRRDNAKYLSLIKAVTLLHQYQREVKQAKTKGKIILYIEVTRGDIAVANMLASAVLGSSIDELPTQTRRLLREIFAHVDNIAEETDRPLADIRFTRRQLRETFGWGHTQLRVHLDRLAAYEYVHVYPGPGRTQLYELRWDGRGREGEPTLFGLTDPASLTEPPRTTKVSAALDG